MTMDENFWIPEAMMRMGDGFVKHLGHLYRKADVENQQKLREVFPEYWENYGFKASANWKRWREED